MLEAVDQRLRHVLGAEVSADEARALGEWYATISQAVATFPSDHLRAVEPPLLSTPGPRQTKQPDQAGHAEQAEQPRR